eukprot:m.639323 g.639323  ORF g.639323 m.639323 type:complete len:120 (-) comp22613_c0_seq4:15-374(-)
MSTAIRTATSARLIHSTMPARDDAKFPLLAPLCASMPPSVSPSPTFPPIFRVLASGVLVVLELDDDVEVEDDDDDICNRFNFQVSFLAAGLTIWVRLSLVRFQNIVNLNWMNDRFYLGS